MSVETETRIPTQPRSFRGIIRAGELQIPLGVPNRFARPAALAERLSRTAGTRGRSALRHVGDACWRRRVGLSFFLPTFSLYVALGAFLAFRYESFNGDAQARLANAYYVLFSRDPHMGAIGFVWNPLPSISVMPLLLLKGLWPALATRAFAGNIMSAAFMAGSVVLIHSILRDLHVRRSARVTLTVLFALQPMIVYYGANGMSEGIFLFFLLLTCRRLSMWLGDGRTWDLVLAGVALAFAYLARNEAVMPAILAAAVVAVVGAVRASGTLKARARSGALHGFLFASPAAFAFSMWALLSWIIVGHPFEQFSSQYGTAAQLGAVGQGIKAGRGGIPADRYVVYQLLALAPLLPLASLGALWNSLRRRDPRALAPAAVLGGVLAFAVVAFLSGQTAGWLRYDITAVPLAALMVGAALARPSTQDRGWRWVRRALAVVLALAVIVPSMVTSAVAMTDSRVAHEEKDLLGYLYDKHPTAQKYPHRYRFRASDEIARYLDAKKLSRGAVLMDTFTPCVPFVALASRHPQQFVITNDRDFQPVLADPVTFNARYILVPPKGGTGDLDEINRTYPSLYESGAGIAALEHEFTGEGCPALRLYRLTGQHTGSPSG